MHEGVGRHLCGLCFDEKWDRRESEANQDLQSEPGDQIGIETEADPGREEGDSLLPFSIDEIRQSNDAGENSDKKS